jgi:hypothetical protein
LLSESTIPTNISSCNVTCTQVGNIGEKSLTFRKIPTFDKVCMHLLDE